MERFDVEITESVQRIRNVEVRRDGKTQQLDVTPKAVEANGKEVAN